MVNNTEYWLMVSGNITLAWKFWKRPSSSIIP